MDVSVVSALRDLTSGLRVPVAQRHFWVLPEASVQHVEVIAPFGPAGGGRVAIAEAMVRELKAAVFPGRGLRHTKVTAAGKSVGVV